MQPLLDRGEVEHAILGVDHVLAAAVTLEQGEVRRVEVRCPASVSAQALQRDIRSLLLRRFSIDLSEWDVAVVPEPAAAERRPEPSRVAAARPSPAAARRLELQGLSLHREGVNATATITVAYGDMVATSSSDGPGSSSSVRRLVADAVLGGVERLLPGIGTLSVRDVDVVTVGANPLVVTVIETYRPPAEEHAAGVAMVRAAGELDATARATLDALNRRVQMHLVDSGVVAP